MIGILDSYHLKSYKFDEMMPWLLASAGEQHGNDNMG